MKTGTFLMAASMALIPASAFAALTDYAPPGQTLSLQVGGGVLGFTSGLNNATNNGDTWDLRAVLFPRSLLGLEGAYVGLMNNFSDGSGRQLMGNGGEALLRLNLGGMHGSVQPYLAAGVGYESFYIRGSGSGATGGGGGGGGGYATVPGSYQSSNDMSIPAAVGIDAYLGSSERAVIGARVGYRTFLNNKVQANTGAADAKEYDATARLGFIF